MPKENLLWRAYLRCVYPRTWWHNRRFPLSLEVRLGTDSVDFSFRGLDMTARRAETMQGLLTGPCHILLSGPSVLNIAEPASLKKEFLIGVNGSPALLSRRGLGMDLYIVDDLAFIRNRLADFRRYAREARWVLVNFGVIAELLRRGVTLRNAVVFDSFDAPFRRPAPPPSTQVVFARRFSDGLKPYGTVAYIALQAAFCLGFREVTLFGLDLSTAGRYYPESKPEPQRLDHDFVRSILAPFSYVGEMVGAGEWRVVNCSPHSTLPDSVLPKANPNEVLAPPAFAATA